MHVGTDQSHLADGQLTAHEVGDTKHFVIYNYLMLLFILYFVVKRMNEDPRYCAVLVAVYTL